MADQTYALAQDGVYAQSNGVFVDSVIPDSGLDHELYRWNAQHALDSGISAGTSGFSWPEENGLLADASAVGGPTLRDDQAGYAASEYDGVDDGHDWSADSSLPTGDAGHSWAVTLYLKTTGVAHAVGSYGNDANGEMTYIKVRSDDTFELSRRDSGVSSSSTVSGGSWFTGGASYDPSDGSVAIYIDGSQDNTGSFSAMNLTDNNHRIGHRPNTYGEYADGYIYDLCLSDGVESSSAFDQYHTNMLG